LAALGVSSVAVHTPPRVAIVRSGDELVPLDAAATVRGAQIVDSNAVALSAAIRAAGGVVIDGGIVADTIEAFATALQDLAAKSDLILSAGGVADGDFDFARPALARAGGEVHFSKVAVRPGSQLAFGAINGVPWLGLPGNPVSALVSFEVFARPIVRRSLGDATPFRRAQRAVLDEAVSPAPDVALLLRGVVTMDHAGLWHVRRAGAQGSNLHAPLARGGALMMIPPSESRLAAGEAVLVLSLDDDGGTSTFLASHA
jgi:molybdopterin molybdotransferase